MSVKILAIGWYVALLVMAGLAIVGVLPQILMGLPMGCLGYYAVQEIREWWRL